MHSVTLLVLLAPLAAWASDGMLFYRSMQGLSPLNKRAVCVQQNPTCVSCFGAGSISCVDASDCYNPTLGQTCCANGYYCDAGSYCVDGGSGCCPNGDSLADCSATASGSVIAPPASTSSAAATSAAPVSASVPSSTVSNTPAPVSVSASPSSTVVIIPGSTSSTIVASTGSLPSANATSSLFPVQTNAAGSGMTGDMALAMGVLALGFLI